MNTTKIEISKISDLNDHDRDIINSFVISHMERTLPDRDFNSQLMSKHLRDTDFVTIAWNVTDHGKVPAGAIYFRITKPEFMRSKVLFMICAVIATDNESSGLASRLAYITVKKSMGIIPVMPLVFVCRTAIPRLVSGWINNSGAWPRIREDAPARIKDLADKLAQLFYPNSEYDREQMMFHNCYGFSREWSYEINYDSIKSKDEKINDYFRDKIFFEKDGKLFTSAHALFMISEITIWKVLKYLIIKKTRIPGLQPGHQV